MKLLFCIKQLHNAVGGAERVLCTICSELAERGHQVTVVSFDPPGSQPFYPLDARVRRVTLAIGDARRSAGLVETLRRMAALRTLARAEQPDVAVGFMHSMFVPMAVALAGLRLPLVGSEHIVPDHYRSRPLQYLLLVATAPMLAAMTVLSEAIRQRYPAIVARRMRAVPNPVSLPSGNGRGANAMMDATPARVLLSVGRLDAQKDHATLLHAFARLAPRHPGWRLRILGEGALRPMLEQLIDTLGLGTLVQMPGVTDRIDDEYRCAAAFVLSSRYESFGLATAEAMSHGLPVVGFADCPGTNELIEDCHTGLLVQPGADRAAALAAALDGLLADAARRQQLGAAGRAAIASRFSAGRVGDIWEQMLADLGRPAGA
jgi:GalNAc-alpha-(1->4)-GalNAc-alpha-(1->3)-diNAcBac-PP-undecaprenol alpha-1,4-N-acetyl-D-galactosaminyltransferase